MPGLDGTGPVGSRGYGRGCGAGRGRGIGWGNGGCGRFSQDAYAGAPDEKAALESRLRAIEAEKDSIKARLAEIGKK